MSDKMSKKRIAEKQHADEQKAIILNAITRNGRMTSEQIKAYTGDAVNGSHIGRMTRAGLLKAHPTELRTRHGNVLFIYDIGDGVPLVEKPPKRRVVVDTFFLGTIYGDVLHQVDRRHVSKSHSLGKE